MVAERAQPPKGGIMVISHTRVIGLAVLALAGTLATGACAGNTGATSGLAGGQASATTGGPAPADAAGAPSQGPGYWGPGYWSPSMMGQASGTAGPGMMGGGSGMMGGGYGLPGDGTPVRSLDQARQRAKLFADRLGLRVGEVMQFSWNFYAELQTPAGQPVTEVLVDPRSGAVGLEYGPAMMWNTRYGMYRTGQTGTGRSAAQAQSIAQQWLRDHGSALTVGTLESYPGYYTMHTMQAGKISGMLSVNATTGQVWYHTWHGTYVATSMR